LKKIVLLLFVLFLTTLDYDSYGQTEKIDTLFNDFAYSYNVGDLVNAEQFLLNIINQDQKIPEEYSVAVYNNLGATSTLLGNYEDALNYYSLAEAFISRKQEASVSLGDIYINKAIIYGFQKSYSLAIEHFEKGIRIYLDQNTDIEKINPGLASAFLNLGIIYLEIKDYKSALNYFTRSAEIKSKFKLPGLALVYLNIAKAYQKANNPGKAEQFYLNSIDGFKREYNNEYFRLADVYFDYGLFLKTQGRHSESLVVLNKASAICLKNYGEKHPYLSLSYKLIGDYYKNISEYKTALEYYQKSLIAIVPSFNNTNIFTNPSIDSALFNIRLLDNLKSKAQALELSASEQNDSGMKEKEIRNSFQTIELALQLIDTIRKNYMSEESRIYLAENEKETYIYATHLAYTLYTMSGNEDVGKMMYSIAMKAKAAVLRNEITENEILYSEGVPDSLRQKQKRLASNISAYNNFIIEEKRKLKPDSTKISLWKDALFDMNREKENVSEEIVKVFPQYYNLIQKTEPVSLNQIQQQLSKDETIVDYLLSNQYSDGKRKLYIFLITRDHLDFHETGLDSLFRRNAYIIRNTCDPSMVSGNPGENFKRYTEALNYMYINLVKPTEELLKGNKLIIIPDEEIGWLPFDAFIKNKPEPEQTDYEGLHYLINDYIFSYGYSSSLIFNKSHRIRKGVNVYSFSPDYSGTSVGGEDVDQLVGANEEIRSINNLFKGKSFAGEKATKENFINTIQEPVIFHLAMHSMSDSVNSRYSYMLFDTHNSPAEKCKLYNYEISLGRISSPMVVLSACNSGTGTLFYGEGLMSLARSFILAGASSVIKTAWNVNDEVSSAIITRFYYYLSLGKHKDEAMRLAKLDFLKGSSPAFKNPYYWTAYEVLGNNEPLTPKPFATVLIISLVVLPAVAFLLYYLRRRSIFSDRS